MTFTGYRFTDENGAQITVLPVDPRRRLFTFREKGGAIDARIAQCLADDEVAESLPFRLRRGATP